MTALYELTAELKQLEEMASSIESDDETMAQAIEGTLEGINLEFNDKAIAIVKISENMAADTNAIDDEIKRLQARKKIINNKREAMTDYLRHNMIASGIKKIESPLFSITLQKSKQRVSILDESTLPDNYISVKTEIKPNKRKILADLKEGVEIPGAEIVYGQQGLLIK